MRLWSIHPDYLDTKGLLALWRETLLAKHVLEGKTKGYRNHPQLTRFKEYIDPVKLINYYLSTIYAEASKRGYKFDQNKIDWNFLESQIPVNSGQMDYERKHLLEKLKNRDNERYQKFVLLEIFQPNPVFYVIDGDIENWEITK